MSEWRDYLAATKESVLQRRQTRIVRGLDSMRQREQYEAMPETAEARMPGRQRVIAFERCRAELLTAIALETGMYLSHDQVRLLDEMRNSVLLRMYNGDVSAFMADIPWLQATLGVTEIHDTVAVIYPRRHGKTLTQTIASTILVLSQPNGNVMSFNPHQDQAKTWLAQAVRWLGLMQRHPEFGWQLDAHTESRTIAIVSNATRTRNSILVYGNGTNARNAQNLRGTGNSAILINIDEGFFIVDEAWEVILPTIANGAALVVTSSMPASDTGALNMLRQVYPHGTLIFRTLDWRHACNDCRAKEARLRREIVCVHIQRKPPAHFRTGTDVVRLKALMAAFGDSYEREMQNMPNRALAETIFDAVEVDRCIGLRPATPIVELGEQTHFFLGIDPGSSHNRSDTAIVSICFTHVLPNHPRVDASIPSHAYGVVRPSFSFSVSVRARASGIEAVHPVALASRDKRLGVAVAAGGEAVEALAETIHKGTRPVARRRTRVQSHPELARVDEQNVARRHAHPHAAEDERPGPRLVARPRVSVIPLVCHGRRHHGVAEAPQGVHPRGAVLVIVQSKETGGQRQGLVVDELRVVWTGHWSGRRGHVAHNGT
jgi:hypothetical protein